MVKSKSQEKLEVYGGEAPFFFFFFENSEASSSYIFASNLIIFPSASSLSYNDDLQ